ncbi:MAG: patatin-like phospholipase family protein [Planctomycetes bacterium]|nr:patatin-like phospholipase family protein [Planctomycetota bacterium]
MSAALVRPKIGLALGAGAARGLAHLGVLTALEENGIPIDVIVGTSFGALVAANYACFRNAREVREKIIRFALGRTFRREKFDFILQASRSANNFLGRLATWVRKGIMFSSTLTRNGFISAEAMSHNIASCVPDCRIEDAAIPFCAVAADVHTGEELLITRGPMRQAVHASCAIAGVFPPVDIGGHVVVDGGCVDKVPVLPALKLGADVVIAVDVGSDLTIEQPTNGAGMLWRASVIEGATLKRMQLCIADVVINPQVGKVHWADFHQPELLAELGETAALAALPGIRSALSIAGDAPAGRLPGARERAAPFLAKETMRFFEIPTPKMERREDTEKVMAGALEAVSSQAVPS